MNIENWWTKFKETETCPNCGHSQATMHEMMGRDPIFSMDCKSCKEGFAFDFSEEKVKTHLLVDGPLPGQTTFDMPFSDVIEGMNKLGIQTENRV
jgi:hypothetical protein